MVGKYDLATEYESIPLKMSRQQCALSFLCVHSAVSIPFPFRWRILREPLEACLHPSLHVTKPQNLVECYCLCPLTFRESVCIWAHHQS